jgi:hypothetical protein
MTVFTPPVIDEVPTYGSFGESAKAARLAKFYKPRPRGVAVYKMTPGNIYFLGRDVPGLEIDVTEAPTQFRVAVQSAREPSQALPREDQVNHTQATSWLFGRVLADFPQEPDVMVVYYGGTSYQVSDDEAALLLAAGFANYLSEG